MNFKEALDYLYSALPMYQRVGKAAYKKDLTNTVKLCAFLGHPEQKFKTIHIAGTNGKGSSAHMLSAILQSAGYRVGLYTSPHLKQFTERIKVSGQEMPESDVVGFVQQIQPVIEDIQPSFFEITVAMAFDYFANKEVDIAVIETGLGGRLDSTNVIQPLVSLITNIGYDHQEMLGTTLEAIAGEKAGIIKDNVPVVIGQTQSETTAVFERKAESCHASLHWADKQFTLQPNADNNLDIFHLGKPRWQGVTLELKGSYQQYNIPGVLQSSILLCDLGFDISDADIQNGLENAVQLTGIKGRWQKLSEHPLTLCDTAHNEAGISHVLEQLNTIPHRQLHIVWGMVNDKVIDKILQILPKEARYYFCEAAVPRALDANALHEKATAAGLDGQPYGDVNTALAKAREMASPDDLIFVGGSTFVVAEIEGL